MTKEERIILRDQLFNSFKESSIIFSSKDYYKINRRKLLSISKELSILYKKYVNEFRSEEEALYCITHNTDYSENICSCNELLKFGKINRKWCYAKSCGKKECLQKLIHTESAKEKAKQSYINKYGVDNPAKSKEVMDKIKATNIEKYGCEYVVQTDYFKEKYKETCLERYSVENAIQSDIIKEKMKESCLEKYGVEHPSQNKDIREKIKNTNIEKYGVTAPLQNKEVLNKLINTNIEKYGVPYVAQNPEIYEKVKKTNLKKYGYEYAIQSDIVRNKIRNTYFANHYDINNIITDNDILEVLKELDSNDISTIYSDNELFTKAINLLYSKKNRVLRIKEIANMFGLSSKAINNRIKDLGLLQYFYIKDSNLELQFKKLLDDNNIVNVIRHDRETLDGKEIDFLLKDYDIGIEINDIKSHNINDKDSSYHIDKTLYSNKKKIRLIHIWEWELKDDILWNRISNWILNICNKNKIKVFARKCKLKLININEEKEFLNKYHLQGYIKSNICIGLYYNNELVQLMSFGKPRYNKNYEYELLRLCTKYNYTISYGSKRILKNFIKSYNPKSIISYCDLSKFTGNSYINLGFRLIESKQPSAIWYNPDTEDMFLHSSLVLKGADKLLGTNYGKGTNNEEIAIISGYKKVYNCGINVYGMNL